MVESLGAEILQIAAFIADHFVFEERQDVTDGVQEVVDRLSEYLGPKIVDFLERTNHAHDQRLYNSRVKQLQRHNVGGSFPRGISTIQITINS